jgi:PGF-CTERM protein
MPDTDTPTSTPTSTPGFGVIVALTALLAAALLVVRRES